MSALLDALLRDLRFGARALRQDAGFTFTVVVTLALAIGVNAGVLGLLDATLLRPLPYAEADHLALVTRQYPSESGIDPETASGTSQDGLTWEVIRDGARSLRAVPYSDWITGVNLSADGAALYVQQQRVGAGYFGVLGVQPLLGREFTTEEDLPDGARVVVLSHGLWRRAFGEDAAIVGKTILLRGDSYLVTGVLPPDFQPVNEVDLWTPLRASRTGEGGGTNYAILARLRDGTAWPAAIAETAALAAQVNAEQPPSYAEIGLSLQPLQEALAAPSRGPLQLLAAAVTLVFVVALVNLAGLVLVRSDKRRGELATRLALGGSQTAVTRQLAVEAAMLAAGGGALAVLVASNTLRLFQRLGAGVLGLWRPVQIDGRLLLLVAALSILAAGLLALVPARRARKLARWGNLTANALRGVAGPSSQMPRRALLLGQVALAVVLLIGAGVLLRSYWHLASLDPGFDPAGLHTVRVSFEDARYATADSVVATLQEGRARVGVLPGVVEVGASLGLPYERLLNLGVRISADEQPITNLSYVTPGYFEALRVRVIAGRTVSDGDSASSTPVVVVNEDFVRAYLEDGATLGRQIGVAGSEREIIGVVASAQQSPGFGEYAPLRTSPMVYVPVTQVNDRFLQLVHGWFRPAWVVRLAGAGVDRAAVDAALASVDPLLPLARTSSLLEVRDGTLAPQRLLAGLLAALALATVALAALGIHASVATSVHERTREIGIRLALGATPAAAVKAMAAPAIVLALGGAALGCGLAVASVSVIRSMVWGISALDPGTYVAVVGLALVVAGIASLVPASRVLRVDPATSLRAD